MRKLNEIQKEMIKKQFGRVAYIIINNVERYGNDKETLQENIDMAYDIMLQQAE
jgi:methylaspartate ammonia-lyase